jgi:hypothetical protein
MFYLSLGFVLVSFLITTRDDFHLQGPSHTLAFNFMLLDIFWTSDSYVVITLQYYICLRILGPVIRTVYDPVSKNEYFDAFCRHLPLTSTVM